MLLVTIMFLNPPMWVLHGVTQHTVCECTLSATPHAFYGLLHKACLFLDGTRAGVLGAPLVPVAIGAESVDVIGTFGAFAGVWMLCCNDWPINKHCMMCHMHAFIICQHSLMLLEGWVCVTACNGALAGGWSGCRASSCFVHLQCCMS